MTGAGGAGPANHLAGEKSPYLLQHAHNPVDWYPWSSAAFALAARLHRPIFLSIGYSTCHWCHVMERESFEDRDIAEFLNTHYVAIKVDREERPDVDALYMNYVTATTGSGGWPMTVFLTPDRKPFFGGTYFPPSDFLGLLHQVAATWDQHRDKVETAASAAGQFLVQASSTTTGGRDETDAAVVVREGFHGFAAQYDRELGGFGTAPKFPRPATLFFLERYGWRFHDDTARDMALATLRAMAAGGMADQLGGGFHRYSTDERWRVPHFEKMLYDQAQLAVAYLEAFQVTRDPAFATTARGILDYVRRDMTSPEGACYSAEDADSAVPGVPGEKREGAYYVWTPAELDAVLGAPDGAFAAVAWGVTAEGNGVRPDPHGELTGRSVLYAAATMDALAKRFGGTPDEARARLGLIRTKLLAARAARPRPHLDDKVLTAWNGLMISAFARGAAILDDRDDLEAARKAARFVLTRLRRPDGLLLRRWRDGEAAVDGFLDDYAALIQGLLDLHEADGDVGWLEEAIALEAKQHELFRDPAGPGYWSTDGKDASLLARQKERYDGAEPCGNSLAALNLVRLARLTDDRVYADRAKALIAWCAAALRGGGATAQPLVLAAAILQDAPDRQIVIAGDPASAGVAALRRVAEERFRPNLVVLHADGGDGQRRLARHLEFVNDMTVKDGRPTAYVCAHHVCDRPTTDPAEVSRQLDR